MMEQLKRPAFLAGTVAPIQKRKPHLPPSKRGGFGNYDIERNNFVASDIKPRLGVDFDTLQSINIGDAVKVELGQKSIQELIAVKIPDPQDIQWLAEKARLEAIYKAQGMSDKDIKRELEVNKPLGREQRTIKSTRNIGQAQLTTEQKLDELKQEIAEGRAENQRQQAHMIAQYAILMKDIKTISNLSQNQLADLGASFARLGVPVSHKKLGVEPRFIDHKYYVSNAGMVNLLLFSKVREQPQDAKNYNYDLLVKNFAANTKDGLPAVKLTTMIRSLQNKGDRRRFLDLQQGGLISKKQLLAVIKSYPQGLRDPDFAITIPF